MFENETNTIQGYIDYLNEILAGNFNEEELRDRLLECEEAIRNVKSSLPYDELDDEPIEDFQVIILKMLNSRMRLFRLRVDNAFLKDMKVSERKKHLTFKQGVRSSNLLISTLRIKHLQKCRCFFCSLLRLKIVKSATIHGKMFEKCYFYILSPIVLTL